MHIKFQPTQFRFRCLGTSPHLHHLESTVGHGTMRERLVSNHGNTSRQAEQTCCTAGVRGSLSYKQGLL